MMIIVFFACLAVVASAVANGRFGGNRYEEIMLPMRDGVKLHTVVVYPRDNDGTKKYPTIMDRSPYGYQDLEWFADLFSPFGFVTIGQDMRGTEKSEGNFTMWAADQYDSRDLGDWIVSQPWSNGEVMTFGASADGLASYQTPKTVPSWLTAQYIVWAPSHIYQILFPFGAYKQRTTEDWLLGLSMPNPDFVNVDIELVHRNEAYSEFWQRVELSDEQISTIKARNAFWGGWYDLFILGTIQGFDSYNRLADPSVRHTSKITIDPLGHCLDSAHFFTEDVVYGRTGLVLAQAFEVFGIRPVKRGGIKNVTFYVMSSDDDAGKTYGQYWTSLDAFPTPSMTDFFLHADHTASRIPSPTTSALSYAYDPANPVPTIGGNNLPDSIGGTIPCGPLDQSSLAGRSDILFFTTEVQKVPMYLSGSILATIFVSSDMKDTDFMVKIADLYPDSKTEILIQDNAVRMRWREGGEEAKYMRPDAVYQVDLNLWNTSFVIAPGHALRVSITSSNYPRFSVNPNNGLLLADKEYPGVNVTAKNTLHVGGRYASKITLPIVQRSDLPNVHVVKEVQEMFPSLTEDFLRKSADNLNKLASRINKH